MPFDYTAVLSKKQQKVRFSCKNNGIKAFFRLILRISRRRDTMNKFTTGMFIGGAMTMAGIGYLMKDKRTYQKVVKKGKKMAVKAEEAIDDMMDNMMP